MGLLMGITGYGQIYFTNEFGSSQGVNKMDINGSNATQLISTGTRTRGIALDVPNNHMYYTNWSLGNVVRANLDGTGQTTLITGLSSVQSIQLDLTGSKMYLTQQGVGLRSANLDGTGLTTILASGGDAEGLALDIANSHIYYVQQDIREVRRVDFAGTNDTLLFTDTQRVNGIAIDSASGKMFWSRAEQSASGTGVIRKANLDGSSVQTIVTGLDWAYDVAVDQANSKLYYTVTDTTSGAGNTSTISSANLDGTSNTVLITGGVAEGAREVAIVGETPAATFYWDDTSGNGLWTTATNWVDDVAPTTGDGYLL